MSHGFFGKSTIAGVAVLLALAASAPASHANLDEGPAGQVALTQWIVSPDPGDLGVLEGYPAGGFAGTAVTVPNTANPTPVKGQAAVPSYEGSVAWYRTTFTAPAAGVYSLSFQSVSYVAEVWIDGQPVGSHVGFDLPFELRPTVAAGAHTLVVRVNWRDPTGADPRRLSPHVVQLRGPRRPGERARGRGERAVGPHDPNNPHPGQPPRAERRRGAERERAQRRPRAHDHP